MAMAIAASAILAACGGGDTDPNAGVYVVSAMRPYAAVNAGLRRGSKELVPVTYSLFGASCERRSETVSPDGAYVLVERNETLYIGRAKRSDLRRLAKYGENPTWSPDGGRLAFDDGTSIWSFQVDGRRRVQVTRSPVGYEDICPVWLKNGREIAFLREHQNALP